jgi:hypothetical protein
MEFVALEETAWFWSLTDKANVGVLQGFVEAIDL